MITIYQNWTRNPVAQGGTLDDARSALTDADCPPGTTFGSADAQMTAFETGDAPMAELRYGGMRHARSNFRLVEATGFCRIAP